MGVRDEFRRRAPLLVGLVVFVLVCAIVLGFAR